MCFDSYTFICDMCDIDWKIVNQKLDKKKLMTIFVDEKYV